ncbi:hypothetical protein NDU88_001831 [Pleurodeles waltl]|uniref:Uncharacterized protein n=1 Tax=Pleurodeles waltl TaxID=8319 RepID=A0AAV7MPK7_PLEWA|nr:hypothetical protein NDU88_001831 [Pleurodeles waltl]
MPNAPQGSRQRRGQVPATRGFSKVIACSSRHPEAGRSAAAGPLRVSADAHRAAKDVALVNSTLRRAGAPASRPPAEA